MDILLHVLGATVLCSVFTYATTPWKFMAVANVMFWLLRETVQSDNLNWTLDKHLEWIAPAVIGVLVAYATDKYFNKDRRGTRSR
jgi:hypothetical protein